MDVGESGGVSNVRYCTVRRTSFSSVGKPINQSSVSSRRFSWSRRLQNLFRKRSSSYSFGSGKKKSTASFETLNDLNGVKINPISRKTGQARVWSVRNSFSKSLEDKLNLNSAHDKKFRRKKLGKQCIQNYRFDVLNSFRNIWVEETGMASNRWNDYDTDALFCENFLKPKNIQHTNEFGLDGHTERLSSFGSSAGYSDSYTSCSFSSSSVDRKNSICTEEDLDTSYWQVPLPDYDILSVRGSPAYNRKMVERRFSESAATMKNMFGSADHRRDLARRRMSDNDGITRCMTWSRERRNSSPFCQSQTISENSSFVTSAGGYGTSQLRKNVFRRRAYSECISDPIKQEREIRHRAQKKKFPTHRSRSVDSRHSQKVPDIYPVNQEYQFAFSDIESSDESDKLDSEESTQPRTDSSSIVPDTDTSSCVTSSNSGENYILKEHHSEAESADFNNVYSCEKERVLEEAGETSTPSYSSEFTPLSEETYCSENMVKCNAMFGDTKDTDFNFENKAVNMNLNDSLNSLKFECTLIELNDVQNSSKFNVISTDLNSDALINATEDNVENISDLKEISRDSNNGTDCLEFRTISEDVNESNKNSEFKTTSGELNDAEKSSASKTTSGDLNDAEKSLESKTLSEDINDAEKSSESKTTSGDLNDAEKSSESKTTSGDLNDAEKSSESKTTSGDLNDAEKSSESKTLSEDINDAEKSSDFKTASGDLNDAGKSSDPKTLSEDINDAEKSSQHKTLSEGVNDADKSSESKTLSEGENDADKSSHSKTTSGDLNDAGKSSEHITLSEDLNDVGKGSEHKTLSEGVNDAGKSSGHKTISEGVNDAGKSSGHKTISEGVNDAGKSSEHKTISEGVNDAGKSSEHKTISEDLNDAGKSSELKTLSEGVNDADKSSHSKTVSGDLTDAGKSPEHKTISEDLNDVGKSSEHKTISEDINEAVSDIPKFKCLSMEELLFCSGKHGEGGDVDSVFEAINKEVEKSKNQEKDMLVMFLVGGELKVLRRSGVPGSHGDKNRSDLPSMTRKDPLFQHNGSQDYSHGHSIHEVTSRGRPKSAVIVTRSQSFAGMANQSPSNQRKEGPPAVVLGESFRHHRGGTTLPPHQKLPPGSRGAVGFSFRKSPKVPKVPRPNRALLMFQSVKRGIREFIEATKEDIEQLRHRETDGTSTAQGRLHEADKQIKSAERYLKRLEFHLAKLDELHEFYLLQQQLREGVRTMHRAYETSPSSKTTMSNVKYGYKECTQTMCNIEAQLEVMMGTFNCKLKGMAGFARLCPGDVFEVTVRHGTQKWKTKGRIEKSGNQKWELPEFNFKAVVGDIINIKGVEVRAFKSILLGQKSCETKDLFSANPQLMTVSINVNGSLKLSIVVTWNPLDGVDDNVTFVETPLRSQSTPRRRPVSVIALNGQYGDGQFPQERRYSNPTVPQTKDDNFILRTNMPNPHLSNNVSSYHGLDSPHVNSRLSEHLPAAYQHAQTGPLHSQSYGHMQAGFHSSPMLLGDSDSSISRERNVPNPQSNQSSVYSSSLPPMSSHLHFPGFSPTSNGSARDSNGSAGDHEDTGVLNIEDVLHNLTSSLEDYHGQYTELQRLEELTKLAQKYIRKQFRNSSRSSSISVSIESALEAFDFLDTEDAMDEPQSPTDNTKSSFDDMLCSPESTAKTADSGIESLAQRLSEDTQLGSSLGSSPVPPSTGNEEVDQCLVYHFIYCERLLENLGAFGPLKCREIYALDKIQKQTTIVDSLLKLAKSGAQVDLHSVMSSICDDKGLREFWVKCTDQNTLYIQPDRLLSMLEQKFATVILERYMIDPTTVCQHVITRVLDIPDYEAEKGRSTFVMTLHQFMNYFIDEGGLHHVEEVAKEMKLVEKLTSGNPDIVIKAILTLRDTLPSAPCLKVIGMLLVTMDREVEQCTISYLNLIQKKQEHRDQAMVVFVEGLEDRTPEIRCGACAALGILEASESIDQLVYLWQSDSAQQVQKKAKDALLSLGDEGRKAFEEAQLSKHGFQGLQVHK